MNEDHQGDCRDETRRGFLKRSAQIALAGALGAELEIGRSAWVGGSDLLRVGLVGCGDRGTGAARNALQADANVKLVAVADVFGDRIDRSLAELAKTTVAEKVSVDPDHRFVGFDACERLLQSGVDVLLLAEPPHFRPAHLAAAIAAGKHVFAEKPVAVDAPGARSVLESTELARAKGQSIVSGLCWRYHGPVRETMRRIHEGALGEIVALHGIYNANGLRMFPRQREWSDMEWQIRNWIYFTWLAGDIIAEQHVHSLDKMAWAMKDSFPVQAVGTGGRQVRTDPAFGHVYDHFAIVYDFENGVKGFSFCRQQDGCATDISDHVLGTKGRADVLKHRISGETPWTYKGPPENMYQNEMNALFSGIRSNRPVNDGEWMTKSTLMAIMGRMAAYTGQAITWEQALNSSERLGPEKYEWGPLAVPPVAMPGITRFL